jgi:hypothetical protein
MAHHTVQMGLLPALPGVVESVPSESSEIARSFLQALNPHESMFHVFISYRVASDKDWVSKFFGNILRKCQKREKEEMGVPFAKETGFPKNFKSNDLADEKLLNVFWDAVTLADAKDWTGDGTRNGGGFIGAIVQSLVFVPVLSCYTTDNEKWSGSIGQMVNPEENDYVDNVLLELTVAKYLFEFQKLKDQDRQGSTLWPCSLIFPIIGHGADEKQKTLSARISRSTNKSAFDILTKAGYSPDEREMLGEQSPTAGAEDHPWSVRSIVGFFLNFQKESNFLDLTDCRSDDWDVSGRSDFLCDEMLDSVVALLSPPAPLNPRTSIFHVFISHQVCDTSWVSSLNSRIHQFALEQDILGKGIPFGKESSLPKNFKSNDLADEKLLNVFWDAVTVTDRRGFGVAGARNGGGFIGAIVQSLVFVPVLSCYTTDNEKWSGSIGQMVNPEENDYVDNVLLELTVAKYLFEFQKLKDQDRQGSTLWPCSLIFPIIGPRAMEKRKTLSARISRSTNKSAFDILTKAGYSPDEREMLGEQSPTAGAKDHPWSVRSIVGFFCRFQGIMLSLSSEQEDELRTSSQKIFDIVHWSISSCKDLQIQRENTNPLATEMQDFLDESFLGHIMPILNGNGITSIRKLSQLDAHTMRLLSIQIANLLHNSEVDEFCKLKDVVAKAQGKSESHALNKRLSDFHDEEASWSTALNSTCAVDMLMRKKFYLFIMVVGSLLMAVVGLFLLLVPTVYTRTLPGSDVEETDRYYNYSTAALCLVGAVGLGPICIGFSYWGSPKKGRYAAAYAFWFALLIVQSAGFVADNANRTICRYLSLDTSEQSVQNCIIVYAVTFGVREIYFFATFLTIVLRQEYYWTCCSWGLCLVLCCNFFIYHYTVFSINNVAITVIVILLVMSLYILSQYNRRKKHVDAKNETKNDADDYQKAFVKYQEIAPESAKTLEDKDYFLADAKKFENEDFKKTWPLLQSTLEGSASQIDVRQHSKDLERLYFLAEAVNTPFKNLIGSFCSSINTASLATSECKRFLIAPQYNDPKNPPIVHLGPIKATQRAIEKVHQIIDRSSSM